MAYSLEDLEQARRHVVEGQQRIGTLSDRIARDRFTGRPTRLAQQALVTMQETLVLMKDHAAAIEADLRQRGILEQLAGADPGGSEGPTAV
jgi:hypothetical protein